MKARVVGTQFVAGYNFEATIETHEVPVLDVTYDDVNGVIVDSQGVRVEVWSDSVLTAFYIPRASYESLAAFIQ